MLSQRLKKIRPVVDPKGNGQLAPGRGLNEVMPCVTRCFAIPDLIWRGGMLLALLLSGCVPSPENGNSLPAASLPDFGDFGAGPIVPIEMPRTDNLEKILIGKVLFNDARLSGDGSLSCASCHDLASGGDDGRRVAIGVHGRASRVNTPTVLNSSLNFAQFWDGRARTLEEQIRSTVENPVEMDGDWAAIESRLRRDAALSRRFFNVYEGPVDQASVVDALTAYIRVLNTPDSPFDRFLKGDKNALTQEQKAGYELFVSLGCVSCHQGQNIGGNFFQRFGVMNEVFVGSEDVDSSDLGRYNVTGREVDRHLFKVPSLRNVAETAPYFHDGRAETLEEAVEIMIQHQLGRTPDANEVSLLAEFLRSLSGQLDEKWQ